MAGDWIPVELATPRKPEVLRIARRTGKSPHEVLGLMVALWTWISEQSADGNVDASVDDVASIVGASTEFWRVVADEGWLIISDSRVTVPNAEKWLANGAKARLAKNQRQKRWRAKAGQNVDASVDALPSTREEKRREEKNTTPPTPSRGGEASVTAPEIVGVPGLGQGPTPQDDKTAIDGYAKFADAYVAAFSRDSVMPIRPTASWQAWANEQLDADPHALDWCTAEALKLANDWGQSRNLRWGPGTLVQAMLDPQYQAQIRPPGQKAAPRGLDALHKRLGDEVAARYPRPEKVDCGANHG